MEKIIDTLRALKLTGIINCLETQDIVKQELSFEEKLEFLLDHELTHRTNKKIQRLMNNANLRHGVRLTDIQSDPEYGLTRTQLLSLMRLEFLKEHRNIVITGATGCGKTYLACAIGNQACLDGFTVKFIKLPTFLEEIQISHQTGTFTKLLNQLIAYDLLILDDWGLTTNIDEPQVHDLFNIIDERYNLKSLIITSQLATKSWHDWLKYPTLADAILDRLLSQTDKIELSIDESLRRKKKHFKVE